MSQSGRDQEHLLASLLSDEEQAAAAANAPDADDDVDSLINALEALVAEGRRMPFHKLLVDEDRLLEIVDRLRTAVPAEVRQAHRVLDQQEAILAQAQAQADHMLTDRGLMQRVEADRRRIMDDADREAERTRAEADRYARSVLQDLEERLIKMQTSIRNGIDALQPHGQAAAGEQPSADV